MFSVRLLQLWSSSAPNNPELAIAQYRIFSRFLPLMYVVLLINTWCLAATHMSIAPASLSIIAPLFLTLVCAVRMLQWFRGRNKSPEPQQVKAALRRVRLLGIFIAVVFTSWSLALFPYGDAFSRSHIAFYMGVTVIACMFSLMYMPAAAISVAVVVNVAFLTFFVATGEPTFIAMAVNLLLVCAGLLIVMVANFRGFETLIVSLQRMAVLNEHNARLTNQDPLTNLPNRHSFFEHLKREFDRVHAAGARLCVGIVDLDGFKPVNDMHGHATGDMLLVEAAQRLAAHAAAHDYMVARIGGNQFAFVLAGAADSARMAALGEEICCLLRAPFVLPDVTIGVSASMGGAIYPDVASSHEQLFDRADYALLQGKRARRGGCTLFSSAHDAQIDQQARIEQALKLADVDNEFRVVFQPIIDARGGNAIGFEALARWHSPVLGNVPPGEFIPVAERAGFVGRLTRPLLKNALAVARGWPAGIRLSFNLSAHDLNTAESVLGLVSIIEGSGFDAGRLDLEITETALTYDFEQVQKSIELLRALGCGISLDDFGTGYSSLARLHALPLTKIKIDRSFVTDLHLRPSSYKIVKSLLTLSRDMGLDCVIEGVETLDELSALSRLGGFLVQGYYYSPPVPADGIAAFLQGPVLGGRAPNDHARRIATGRAKGSAASERYAGLSDDVMEFISQFDPSTLDPLLEGLAACDMATAIFDPADRLIFASPVFRELYCVEDGEQTFSSIIRHCYEIRQGPQIQTTDIEAWLAMANSRRRTIRHRKFEVDLVDGRWLWALETTYGEGWVLLAFMDLTTFKRKEIDLRIARDAAVLIAETDHLTGLASRRSTMQYLEDSVSAARSDAPLTVALMDIDHFKQINDTRGHDIGDKVLQLFGHHACSMFRNSDRVGRLGGEEFLLIMPNTDEKSALRAVQRFRRHWQRISGLDVENAGCTFSAGLAQWRPGQGATELYRAADQALYAAKSSGRNRVAKADHGSAQVADDVDAA